MYWILDVTYDYMQIMMVLAKILHLHIKLNQSWNCCETSGLRNKIKWQSLILGSEKDYLKLYHGDFLESFVKSKQQFRLLSACSEKTAYIFDDLERKNIKKLSKDIENHLCFILKDNGEMLFFTKNANSSEELFAMWTNSKSMVYSMKLLFESLWTSSKNIHL